MTIEELEARLETVNVERDDLKQRLLDMVLQRNDVRDKLDICALDLVTAKRERDEARAEVEVIRKALMNALPVFRERNEAIDEVQRFRDWYRNAFGGPSKRETPWDPCACEECESLRRLKDEQPVHPSNLTDVVSLLEDERDEARAEAERLSDARTHWQVMLKRETEEVERLQVACHAWAEDMREAGRLCEQAGNEMPIDAVRRFVSSKAAIVDMLQDRLGESRSEVDRLTDERDELLVRVADAGAELRATREAYADAYRRGVEAMREAWCRIRALPIPEEP
jgi:hypothetical protein